MKTYPSRFMQNGDLVTRTMTDVVKQMVADELERQRDGLDGLKGLRAVAITVKIPPTSGIRAVIVSLETER